MKKRKRKVVPVKLNLLCGQCYFCKQELQIDSFDSLFMQPQNELEGHHIFYGNPNRQHSDDYGLIVELCSKHHRNGKTAVHNDYERNLELKQYAQREFEKVYSHEKFMEIFKRNYLY